MLKLNKSSGSQRLPRESGIGDGIFIDVEGRKTYLEAMNEYYDETFHSDDEYMTYRGLRQKHYEEGCLND